MKKLIYFPIILFLASCKSFFPDYDSSNWDNYNRHYYYDNFYYHGLYNYPNRNIYNYYPYYNDRPTVIINRPINVRPTRPTTIRPTTPTRVPSRVPQNNNVRPSRVVPQNNLPSRSNNNIK